jgi:hypothetical protein
VPNTNPQAIFVTKNKVRPAADKFMQAYNLFKALQAEGAAENWLAMFPADAEPIVDGAEVDGRTIISNQDVRDFIGDVTAFINFIEANSNAVRNRGLKIAVNPERF